MLRMAASTSLVENGRLTLRQMIPEVPQEKVEKARHVVASFSLDVEDYRELTKMLGLDPWRGGGMISPTSFERSLVKQP